MQVPGRLDSRSSAFIPCFDDAAVSATRRVKLSIRRSRHWQARTPISISTMFNQLACLGT
jgi:hypothetical protein